MADYLPKLASHAETIALTGTVTGGQIITFTGVVAGANATDWLGVASRDGVSGDYITVYSGSVQRLTAGGAITVGTPVKCAAGGKVVAATYGTDAQHLIVGKAEQAATADGDVIAVKMER